MSDLILTISLLVSGREDTTGKCLDSLRPLMEQVPSELILVDTGCSEEFREQLQSYTDQIIPFVWCDDFAKARNAGLEKAGGEWFMFLDDDEWFEDVTPIVDFFVSGEYKEYDQAVYRVRNYNNMEGTAYSDDWVSRLIHLESNTHFEGRVHESLVPARGRCKRIQAFAHHYGYVFRTEEEKRAHFDRNVTLLEKLMEEEPLNMRWPLQMLQECFSMGDGKGLIDAADRGIDMLEQEDQSFGNLCRGAFFSGKILGLGLLKEAGQMDDFAASSLEDSRNPAAAACSISYYAATRMAEADAFERTVSYCKTYCDFYEHMQQEARDEQAQTILESIVLVKDAITQEARERIVLLWAKALIALGRINEFPEKEKQEILGALRRFVDGNGEFLELPEEIWQLGISGLLPLEEELLSLSISQWMAQVMVLQSKKKPELWKEIREHLRAVRTREDIRYHYFAMHDANAVLEQGTKGESYDRLREKLSYFVVSNLTYAHEVYTPKAFEGRMEILPASCRAAVHAQECLQCGAGDWSTQLEALKHAAKEFPPMGGFVKALAKEIGKEQERQAEAAADARDELQEMAKQVRAQVIQLMDQGMYMEAYEIVRQLRQMLPDDKETKRLEEKLEKQFS